jgi:hypothetical protein
MLGLHDQQLIERWWIHGIAVGAIVVVDSVFCHRKSRD